MMLQEHGIEFGRGGVRAALGQSFVGGRCARERGFAEAGGGGETEAAKVNANLFS